VTVARGDWPELPYEEWLETRDTLHMYLQVIGKVRLALAPMEPQWAQVPLYVTARGLNTSPIPHAAGVFDIDIDLVDHVVAVRTAHGAVERIRLEPRSVADFYGELMAGLERAEVPVEITLVPQEVPQPIPFPEDTARASYEPGWANTFWRVLVSADEVMKEHRARFRGKASPVHLFWGSLDLAYTRFSGRFVEPPPDADVITRFGADAEQICAGFWPGDARYPEPAFFSYPFPHPKGVEEVGTAPADAGWNADLGEFLLPYEAVRTAPDPRRALLDFLESTYRAPASLARWDPALVAPADVASARASSS
jgi:Family of unknown function (DUF5996)